MTIGADYSTPVTVNGFLCKNCTDVDYAKKHIDPAHPKSGPYGIDAKDDPSVKKTATSAAVTFGGNLGNLNARQAVTVGDSVADPSTAAAAAAPSGVATGTQLDVSA
jgi:phosphoglycolate phosphatase-like HAD superfamily hydrolase